MMKTRTIIGMMVVLMTLAGMTAYGNEINLMDNSDVNEVYDFSKAIGITWKLYGFGTLGEDVVQKAKPEKGEEWCKEEQYTILFKEDGTLKGHTFSNEFFGEYSINGNKLVIGDLWATEVGEEYDGDKYYEALYSPLTHAFEIKGDQLLLYYNEGQNYLLFDNVTNHAMAQTDYYYYKGAKIPLILNKNKVCISTFKDNQDVNKRIHANVQVLETVSDEFFDIIVIAKSDFEKLTSLDFWEKDAKSVILTSCYYTENSEEVCASPYLNVKLKKKEDAELLTSYVEKFRLLNLGPFSQNLPLWFVLYVTPESEISPLVCANELYESGLFAESVADLVSLQSELTTVRGITSVKTNESSEIYDMLGRRLSVIPQKGVYIQNGKKKLMK